MNIHNLFFIVNKGMVVLLVHYRRLTFILWLSIYIPYIRTKPQEHYKLSFVGTDHSEPFLYRPIWL